MTPSSDRPMDAAINKLLRPHAVIWAVEVYDCGKWKVRACRSFLGYALRDSLGFYHDTYPDMPRRIKAYVRWSNVREEQQAEERAIAWAEGPESKHHKAAHEHGTELFRNLPARHTSGSPFAQ